MKRRLQLLNLVLLTLVVMLGFRFHRVWQEAREREQQTLLTRYPLEKAVALPPLPKTQPVSALSYIDIAQKMLLAKDRNPNVIYDPPPPPPAPKPMPPLPHFHGLMMFGKPGIILSEKADSQKTYRPGDKIGEFTLLAFDNTKVEFEWEGQKVERRLDELVDHTAPQIASNASAGGTPAAPPPQVVNVSPLPLGPGQDVGGGFRACQPNDSTPTGTVQGGVRKVEVATPFGKSCRWEPAK